MTDKKQKVKVPEPKPKEEEQPEEVEEEEEDEQGDEGEGEDADQTVEESGDGDEKKDESSAEKVDEEPFDFDETLKLKVTLSDGNEAAMFSRGPKYADDLWPINCHLCRVGNLITEEHLMRHVRAKGHKSNLSKDAPDAKKYMEPFRQPFGSNPRITTPLKILPGEIITEITDDMKDRVIKKEEFQFKVPDKGIEALTPEPMHDYNKRAPVMGLCYAFKMKKFGRPKYFCALCKSDIYGEAYQHFVGAHHQAEYVVKHFPKIYEKVVKLLGDVATQSVKQKYIRNIFRKIYRKIETAKGNKTVTVVDSIDFKRNRRRYVDTISKMDHYNENTIEIPDADVEEYVKKTLSGMALMKADLISLVNPREGRRNDGLHNPKEERQMKRRMSPVRDEPPAKSRRDERRRFEDCPQAWDRYRRMIGAVLDDLDELYERYEKEPENHPSYSYEWKKYWRNRCKELEKDNIDVRYYDFNKEWIPYWERRLQEYHAKDIVKRKFEMKKTLHLSYDARSPSPLRLRRPRRSPSPPQYGNERRYQSRRDSGRNVMMNQAPVIVPNEPLSVISVMRLLTALEDQLGSLGPKAVQLLSRAVLSEKNNQNPNDLLMENDFHVFFMTAKEKLKGQLIANIVEPSKIRAVKSAVTDLTTILGMFEEFISRNGGRNQQQSLPPQQQRSHRGNSMNSGGGGGGGNRSNQYDEDDRDDNRGSGGGQYGGSNSGNMGNQFPNQYSGGNQGGVWQSGAYRGGDNGSRYNDNQNSMPSNQNYRGGNDNGGNFSSYGSGGGGGGGGGGGSGGVGAGGGGSGGRGDIGDGRMNQGGGGYQGNNDGRGGYQQNQSGGSSGYGSQNQGGGSGGGGYNTNSLGGNTGGGGGYNTNNRNSVGGGSGGERGYQSNNYDNMVGQQTPSLMGSGGSGGGLDLARNSSRALAGGVNRMGMGIGQKMMGGGGGGGYGGGGQGGGYNNRSNQMMNSQYNRPMGNDNRRY